MEKALILGRQVKGLYSLNKGTELQESKEVFGSFQLNRKAKKIAIACFSDSKLWHFHLQHSPFDQMKYVGLFDRNNLIDHGIYQMCPMAKMHRNAFPLSTTRVLDCFELLHVDIWGPYPHSTYNRSKFFLTIIDDHSRATRVLLLTHKTNAFPLLKAFVIFIEKQFGTNVKL